MEAKIIKKIKINHNWEANSEQWAHKCVSEYAFIKEAGTRSGQFQL